MTTSRLGRVPIEVALVDALLASAGKAQTLGEVLRQVKTNIISARAPWWDDVEAYCLLGDPALVPRLRFTRGVQLGPKFEPFAL